MRRKLALAAAIVLVAAAIGHTLMWRAASHRLAEGFTAWLAGRRAQAWVAANGAPVSGGWPDAVTLTVPDIFLSGGDPDIPGGLVWSADRIVLTVDLADLRELHVAVQGMQRLRVAGAPEIAMTADSLQGTLPLDPGVPAHHIDLTAKNLRAGIAGSSGLASGATITSITAHLEFHPAATAGEPALAFNVDAMNIAMPPLKSWPARSPISRLAIEGAFDGPAPRSPGLIQRASAWRDGGGTLEIGNLAVTWGALSATATATLTLDEQLQPLGTGSAHIEGYAETLDSLAAGGTIGKGAATAGKVMLSLIARADDDGHDAVEVPLTLHDRSLSIRQWPIARLPELVWPER
jgi:hypothetical protein